MGGWVGRMCCGIQINEPRRNSVEGGGCSVSERRRAVVVFCVGVTLTFVARGANGTGALLEMAKGVTEITKIEVSSVRLNVLSSGAFGDPGARYAMRWNMRSNAAAMHRYAWTNISVYEMILRGAGRWR